jgi:glutathione S-transferase
MSDITLYGNRYSGHSYKVRLFLALTDTPHDYKTIDLLQPRTERPAEFQSRARYGEVPLLIIGEQSYVQSNAILLHMSEMLGTMDGETQRSEVAEWLMWEQSRLGFSLPNLRFECKFRSDTDPALLSWLEARLRNDLGVLDAHLSRAKSFIVGDAPTIADCSIAGYLYWLSDAALDVREWPEVEAWLERMSLLEGWEHPDILMR